MTLILQELPGVRACFFDREQEQARGMAVRRFAGELSPEEEHEILLHNQQIAAEGLSVAQARLAMGIQVHGNNVLEASRPGVYAQTDGLITTTENLAVAVMVADCAALLLADPANRVAAAIHAGWRGAVAGIVQNGIQAMVQAGADPKQVRAWLSPCISAAAFEVGEEVAEQFPRPFVHTGPERPHIDLQGYLRQVLLQCDISPGHIVQDIRCTRNQSDLFHSHRRDSENSGRMLAAISLCGS